MFAQFGFGLLVACLVCAQPVWAQDERPEAPPDAATLQPAHLEPVAVQTLQPVAYDVILVPRPAGATRSRMFNGERWVTLPDGSRRYASPDRTRNPQAAWRYPRWDNQRSADQRDRWSTYRPEYGRAYGQRQDYRQRRNDDNDRAWPQRYRTSEQRW